MSNEQQYRAGRRNIEQLLTDYEDRKLDATYKGSTTEYLHAAIMVKAAQRQQLWAMVASVAACVSVVLAVVALAQA
jgi:hypothetical protein